MTGISGTAAQASVKRAGDAVRDEMNLTPALIEEFLEDLGRRGRTPGTVATYRRRIESIYDALPEDKRIARGTLAVVQDRMLEQGTAPSTANLAISAVNSLLEYSGRREFQLRRTLDECNDVQPELTRTEYLRILSAARALEKERTYLLVKVFATLGLFVNELNLLTLETVKLGRLDLLPERVVPIPDCLREELLAYAQRIGVLRGPIFITRRGKVLNRSNVTVEIQRLARDARVEPEKCNPRCLRKLYQETQAEIHENLETLAMQTYNRLLEKEQLTIGWTKG